MTLYLGDRAKTWEDAIKKPKSRVEKMGLKPGHAYRADGDYDAEFVSELHAIAGPPGTKELDLLVIRAVDADALEQDLTKAMKEIKPNGMVWVVWAKGRKEFNENHVRETGLATGLVDVKVMRFDETFSALKFVIPKNLR